LHTGLYRGNAEKGFALVATQKLPYTCLAAGALYCASFQAAPVSR
jgi:hypothetical protein